MNRLSIIAALVVLTAACRTDSPPVRARLSVAEALGGADTTGYARARAPRAFAFPADHGPHPAFRSEWWYFTGNLETEEGRPFGFQLTFFRNSLAPAADSARASAWATNQLYMAHFTVTDVAGRRFFADERFSRGAVGLAGAGGEPLRVWLEDWSAEAAGDGFRLRADQGEAALELRLAPEKPVVLQGDRGLSRKGAEPGNASYYYSLTRMRTEGAVRVGGQTHRVRGLSWMDREWSTSALGADQVGWDWFALHLSDGYDLMYYQLRRRDGSADAFSRGVLVGPDGAARPVAREEVTLGVLGRWPSPRGGAPYPAGWRLRIPSVDLDLEIAPVLADQELDVSVRYWEGAVRVRGRSRGRPVEGRGYVELTGYADDLAARSGR